MVVENNKVAGEYFRKMLKLDQDPTHTVWFENADRPYDLDLLKQLTSAAVFQKTDFKSESARNPKPGTFAEVLINRQ